MKKILMLVFCLGFVQILCAQTMTDEQVKAYVIEAQGKGLSQQEIAKELLVRGVSMDQVNRIKREAQYKSQQEAGLSVDDESRMRTIPEGNLKNVEVEDGEIESEMEIFGHRIFQSNDVAFEASYNLPTPSDYKLGPGDQVAIDVWGASQSSLLKTISPDGNIGVENLGPIYLNGLTVSQANNLLKQKFESYNIRQISIDTPFTGGYPHTVSAFVAREGKIQSVQLEINSRLVIDEFEEFAFKNILDALIDITNELEKLL